MLTWEQILESVVQGYDDARRYAESTFEQEDINKLRTEIQAINSVLKDVARNKVLKQFFEQNVLSQETVDELGRKFGGSILIDDFDPDGLRPANYDLRLGDEVYVTAEKLPKKLNETEDTIAIQPGEFGILTTYEYIHVPLNYLGLISLRFNYKKQGLMNISGFHVDPGFTGKIIFSVFNTGPRSVALRYKERVFMIMFEELSKPLKTGYSGGFSEQKHIPVDIITSLGGQSVSVISLDRRLRKLETNLRVLEAILVGLIIAGASYLASTLIFH